MPGFLCFCWSKEHARSFGKRLSLNNQFSLKFLIRKKNFSSSCCGEAPILIFPNEAHLEEKIAFLNRHPHFFLKNRLKRSFRIGKC